MLQLNLKEICRIRGIEKPYSFLVNAGFSAKTAHKLSNDKVAAIKLAYVEKLCTLLFCEPSDLFVFTPVIGVHYGADHPLLQIGVGVVPERIDKKLSVMPLKQLIEVTKKFNEEKG